MGPSVLLDLFPDVDLNANIEIIEEHAGITTWRGRFPGNSGAYALISQKDGVFYGKIVGPDFRTYQIIHKAGPVYVILEVDPSVNDLAQDDGVEPETAEDVISEPDHNICHESYACASTSVNIDILIVYTPAAKALYGNATDIENAIATAVAEMNTVNANSDVNHTYTLVHVSEVNFTESGSSSADLSALRSSTDGVIDQVHSLRYTYQADLVSMITDNQYCGRGYVQSNTTYFSNTTGFNVAGANCMATNLTLAHECGHNMGLHHDYFVNSSSTPCSHHHGYVNQEAIDGANSSQRWRTVMAYNTQCADTNIYCTRLPYWSNPDKNYNGDPMGIPIGDDQPSNSAFALNRSACLVADMSDQLSPFPVIYDTWQVSGDRKGITLNWSTAQEINNKGFEIEMRSEQNEEFAKIAFVPGKGNANEITRYTYKLGETFPGKHYFRLKQIDIDGSFEYSSVKEVNLAQEFKLYHKVYPNPLTDQATMELIIPESEYYSIKLTDINGKVIRQVFEGELQAGTHQFNIKAEKMLEGLYFYMIDSPLYMKVGKLWVNNY